MKEKAEGLMKTAVFAYLALTLVMLPLYMKNGMVMIGDAKYNFYFNYSVFLLAVSVIASVCLCSLRRRGRPEAEKGLRWSVTDWCVAGYGVTSVFSCLLSDFHDIALWGYPDWHMGLATQLLLVWSYFLISRWYDGGAAMWMAAGCAGGVVFFIGMLNRFGADPLRVFQRMDFWDWNRRNLLSTIGNINWYCGYLCAALPAAVFFYWRERGILRIAAGGILGVGLLSLLTQGSESGYAALAGILLVLFWSSLESRRELIRFLQTLLWIPGLCLAVMAAVRCLSLPLFMPEDSAGVAFLFWKGWPVVFLLLLAGTAVLTYREKCGRGDLLRGKWPAAGARGALIAALSAGAALFILCQFSDSFWQMFGGRGVLRLDDAWGNGRGALWRMGAAGVMLGDIKQFLLGAGPDCFAPYVYSLFDVAEAMRTSGQWRDAVFANAHNEWLNMLVTQGALGVVFYLGIFSTAFLRYLRIAKKSPVLLAGALCIAGYTVNNIFSFQQIVSTPVIFALIAMCERLCGNAESSSGLAGWRKRVTE